MGGRAAGASQFLPGERGSPLPGGPGDAVSPARFVALAHRRRSASAVSRGGEEDPCGRHALAPAPGNPRIPEGVLLALRSQAKSFSSRSPRSPRSPGAIWPRGPGFRLRSPEPLGFRESRGHSDGRRDQGGQGASLASLSQGSWASGFRLQTSGFSFRVQTSNSKFQLSTLEFKVQTSNFKFQLWASDSRPQVSALGFWLA